LTTTSRRPECACARWTASVAAALSVTSRVSGRIASPWAATRSLQESVLRAVAATLSPRSRAASASWQPKPHEEPAMNQILLTGTLLLETRRYGETIAQYET
jgi:hypothetical protein